MTTKGKRSTGDSSPLPNLNIAQLSCWPSNINLKSAIHSKYLFFLHWFLCWINHTRPQPHINIDRLVLYQATPALRINRPITNRAPVLEVRDRDPQVCRQLLICYVLFVIQLRAYQFERAASCAEPHIAHVVDLLPRKLLHKP